MLRIFWLFLLFFLNIPPLFAQTQKDSLVIAFEQSPGIEDKDFEKLLYIVYELSDYGYHKKAEEFAIILIEESKKNKILSRQARSYHLLGYVYKKSGSFEKSLVYYEKSLQVRKKMNDRKGEALVYRNMANIYYDMSNYKQALYYQQQNLTISRELKDQEGEAIGLSTIGNIYSDQENHSEALKHYQKALNISVELVVSLHIANTLSSIGITKHYLKENDSAIYYLNQALTYALPDNKYTACYATRFMGQVYTELNDIEQAEAYFRQSMAYAKEINSPFEVMLTQIEMANLYINQNNTTKAIALSNEVLVAARKLKFVKGEITANKILYEAYQQERHFEQALEHYKRYQIPKDSLNSLEEKKLINDLQTQIKVDEERHNLKTAYQTQKMKWFTGIIALGFLIVLTIVYFLFRSKNRKKAFELSLKEIENQSQEKLVLGIQKERKQISQDLHDDLGGSLSGMQMFTEMICGQTTDITTKTQMEKLLSIQKEITLKVREMIWFVGNDSGLLESFIKYSRHYAENLFENYPISLAVSVPGEIPNIQIPEKDRKNFFLTYKEVLNNAIKHARTKNINITFEFENDFFSVCIADNGKGFNAQNTSRFSYGLKNIVFRMKEINAQFEIQSSAKGTQVRFGKKYLETGQTIIEIKENE